MFPAAFISTNDALNIWRFVRLWTSRLRAVSLAAGSGAGWKWISRRQDVAGGNEARDIFGGGGWCQMILWHWRRRAYLQWSTTAATSTEDAPGVPRGPRGRRGHQRHRGGGAARREPQLQRGRELWVMGCRHPAWEQGSRRGRVNHPGSRQGVRASCPPSNHPGCLDEDYPRTSTTPANLWSSSFNSFLILETGWGHVDDRLKIS